MRLLRLFRQRPRQHLLHSQHPLLNLHRRLRRHPHPHLSLSLRRRQRPSLDQPQQLQLQRERRSRQMFRTNFFHQLCVV
jgi:hypothetical protein